MAIIRGRKILSHIKQSQDHTKYGGVVPEHAARLHSAQLSNIVRKALGCIDTPEIDAIAATIGPGLLGSLIVGSSFGKSLAFALGKPFIAVNHIKSHVLVARMVHEIEFPLFAILASGGHCKLFVVNNHDDFTVLGETKDDAIGEVFDKVAVMLGMEYPGGMHVERCAANGDSRRFSFPKPFWKKKHANMSFSGLKNAVRLCILENGVEARDDICASFQRCVGDVLEDRISQLQDLPKTWVFGGGVASNRYLCERVAEYARRRGCELLTIPQDLCTDNGVMIAWAGHERMCADFTSNNNKAFVGDSLDTSIYPS